MIVSEYLYKNGRRLVRTYSDAHLMIKQDGTEIVYSEAVDPIGSGRTYTETDITIEQTDEERVAQLEEDSKALKILLGEEGETE